MRSIQNNKKYVQLYKEVVPKKTEVFNQLKNLILKYHIEKIDSMKQIYRVYSDGQVDFCRNISRGNWHMYRPPLLKKSSHIKILNTIFPNSELTPPLIGWLHQDKYITCYKKEATEIYSIMEIYTNIIKLTKG
jgi:hypothetical protein